MTRHEGIKLDSTIVSFGVYIVVHTVDQNATLLISKVDVRFFNASKDALVLFQRSRHTFIM